MLPGAGDGGKLAQWFIASGGPRVADSVRSARASLRGGGGGAGAATAPQLDLHALGVLQTSAAAVAFLKEACGVVEVEPRRLSSQEYAAE